jgi:hypothetical protein
MSRQLRTWKEIAQHLGVSVRTAQNWERDRKLPVRRITGGEKSQVRALVEELDDWFAQLEQPPPITPPLPPVIQTAATATLTVSPELAVQPNLKIGHLFVCCTVYAALFVLDLFLEISYQFDRLGRGATIAAPFVAAWIVGSSAFGLWASWRRIATGRLGGFALLFIIFATAGTLVFAALTLTSVLPREPITILRFPAQPAEIAYLKNVVFYFLPLITTVWLVPFHFVACLHRQLRASDPRIVLVVLERKAPFPGGVDALYLPAAWLVVGMILVGFASVIMTQDLLRNLIPSRYTNLFMVLALTKSASYFGLGMLCTAWYSRALAEIRGACPTY